MAFCGIEKPLLPLISQFSSVQSLSHVRLFATPWIAARQASPSITNSQSSLKPMSIESMIPSNHLIFCCPLLFLPSIFPAPGSFPMSWLFTSGGQSTGASASASAAVLPMNIQDWFPLGLTGLISWLSRIVSSTTVWKHQLFGAQPSLWSTSYICAWLVEKLCPFTLSLSRPFPFCYGRNRSTERLSYLLRVTP